MDEVGESVHPKAKPEDARGESVQLFAGEEGDERLMISPIETSLPRMKSENFSQPHVIARASFSI